MQTEAIAVDPQQFTAGVAWERQPPSRGFWIALACAFLVHALLLVELKRAQPRYIGDANGQADALSVELISAAELDRRSEASAAAAGAPPSAQAAAQPQPEVIPEVKPAEPAEPVNAPAPVDTPPPVEQAAPVDDKPAPVEAPPPVPAPVEAETPAAPAPPALKPTTAEEPPPPAPMPAEIADLGELPLQLDDPVRPAPKDPTASAGKPPEPAKRVERSTAAKPKPREKLDLAVPKGDLDSPVGSAGRSSAVGRPPGITRSGWNDDFGRQVVRALRQTMPNLGKLLGRATVTLVISNAGALESVKISRSSGMAEMDRNIVFAVKQSSFPFPPMGATLLDRTFHITYIYN